MFNPKVLRVLAEKYSNTFKKLNQVEAILNQRFAGLERTIRALVLAVASGEPMLLVGPPGSGKTYLTRDLVQRDVREQDFHVLQR